MSSFFHHDYIIFFTTDASRDLPTKDRDSRSSNFEQSLSRVSSAVSALKWILELIPSKILLELQNMYRRRALSSSNWCKTLPAHAFRARIHDKHQWRLLCVVFFGSENMEKWREHIKKGFMIFKYLHKMCSWNMIKCVSRNQESIKAFLK